MNKKVMLVTLLLLAILTLGAVSASDDVDALAVDDESGDAVESPLDEDEGIALDVGDETLSDGLEEKYNVTVDVSRSDEVFYGDIIYFWTSVYPTDDECEYYPQGDIIVYVNDEEVISTDVDSYFDYSFEDFGEYNFKVKYSGDDYFNPGEVTFTYNLTRDMYRIVIDNDITYLSSAFMVYSPVVLSPTDIVITINGKKFSVFYDDDMDDYYCNASALNYGLNTVNVYYPGDEEFAEYSDEVNITSMAYCEWVGSYNWGDPVECYLKLPSDATGTLKVYSVEFVEGEDNVYKEIGSANVTDGVATVILYNLSVGENHLYAHFNGSVEVNDDFPNIRINPLIDVPKVVLTGNEEYITVFASDDSNGLAEVYYRDYEDYDADFEFLGSANVLNGQAKIPLSSLKEGTYEIEFRFCPDKNYTDEYSQDTYYIYVMDEIIVNLNITYWNKNALIDNEDNYVEFELPYYAEGVVTLYVDGKAMQNMSTDDEDFSNYFYFNTTGFSIGEHTLSINFTSETQGNSSESVKFNVSSVVFYIPDKMNINDRDHVSANSIEVYLYDMAKGTITISIDNEKYLTKYVDVIANEKSNYIFALSDVARGKHDVVVTYNDDKYGICHKNKTVEFSYVISIYGEWLYGEDNNITLNVPSDLGNGDLTITIDGTKYSYERDSSEIIVNPSKLSIGNHTVVAKYAGDDFYPAKEFNYTFEVYPQIKSFDYSMLLGTDEGVYLVLPSDAKGKLNVTIKLDYFDEDGDWVYKVIDSKLVSFEDGKAYYSFADLDENEYYVEVSYTGSDYSVDPIFRYLEVSSVDWGKYYLDVGENKTITFIARDKEPGQLRVVLSRIVDEDLEWDDPVNLFKTVNVTIIEGKANYTFASLPIGHYHIFIAEEFIDGGLKGFQGSQYFHVECPYVESPYGEFDVGKITPMVINLPSDATGKAYVTVYANYSKDEPDLYNIFEVTVNGITTIDLNKIVTEPGYYGVNVNYTGNYGEFERFYSGFRLLSDDKVAANIGAVANDVKVGSDVVINITSPQSAGKIVVTIDSVNFKTTVDSGNVTLSIPNLKVGSYEAVITFEGDSLYFGENKTVSFTVFTDPVIVAKNSIVVYASKGKYSVKVYGTDGKLATNTKVIIKLGNVQVGKVFTNPKGIASYTIKAVPGTYKITATSLGKSVTKRLVVKHLLTLKKTTLKKSAKKLTLQASLAKVNGKYLKNKQITFRINGKKVAVAKTNKKGIAIITIKNPNVVKNLKVGKNVKYQATYLKDTVTKTTKIKK